MKAILIIGLSLISTLTYSGDMKLLDVQYPASLATKEGTDTKLVISEDQERGVTCYMYSPKDFKVEYVEKNGRMRTHFDGNNVGSISCVKTHKGTDPKYNEKP